MKVLVTGAGGQLGHDLQIHCEAMGDEVVAVTHAALDVADRDAVYQALLSVRPDVVLHAGAWTAVDACEGDPDRAFRVNALGTRWVADACRRAGAFLCYMSTDYVFDGTKEAPYLEWDPTGPQSVYGASKLAGEHEVSEHAPGACTVRTSWVCGEHGGNMVKTVLALADRPELAFVDDQRGCPSFTADLAIAIRSLAASRCRGCSTSPTRALRAGTSSFATSWRRRATIPRRCGPSPPPISIRPVPRPGRRTRSSTTPRCGRPASPCSRTTERAWVTW